MVAALGGVERKGRWIPARQNYAVSVMGGVSLDFREALLPPGETEVLVFTAMGGAEIIVPPGLAVESDGMAILGGFEHREDAVGESGSGRSPPSDSRVVPSWVGWRSASGTRRDPQGGQAPTAFRARRKTRKEATEGRFLSYRPIAQA